MDERKAISTSLHYWFTEVMHHYRRSHIHVVVRSLGLLKKEGPLGRGVLI
jgi:hypothetical protein